MTAAEPAPLPAFDNSRALFVFDGHCGFCSAAVQFVLRHDKAHRINLTPAQGPLGSALYAHFGLRTDNYDTNLLIENGHLLTKSDASLRLFELLGWPWRAAGLFRLVPPALRDVAYGVVARNRMRIWGRRDQCLMPTPDERDRFIGL